MKSLARIRDAGLERHVSGTKLGPRQEAIRQALIVAFSQCQQLPHGVVIVAHTVPRSLTTEHLED